MMLDRLSLFRPGRGGTDGVYRPAAGASGNPIVCIGRSHTRAIARAAQRAGANVRVINLSRLRRPFLKSNESNILRSAIVKLIGNDDAPIFSMIGGNTHNIMGLARHPRQFVQLFQRALGRFEPAEPY